MIALLDTLAHGLFSCFRDGATLQFEIMALRHELETLRRQNRSRLRLTPLAKYMEWRRCPPDQSWRPFWRNHADGIAAMDFLLVPTAAFRLLFGLVILRHDRRQLVHSAVTTSPTANWFMRQISEVFPWGAEPTYLKRDRDGAYGEEFKRRIRAMGIRDRPTAPR